MVSWKVFGELLQALAKKQSTKPNSFPRVLWVIFAGKQQNTTSYLSHPKIALFVGGNKAQHLACKKEITAFEEISNLPNSLWLFYNECY